MFLLLSMIIMFPFILLSWILSVNPSCPIILGRPFLSTVGAVIDMKEGNIRLQFPLKKVMEHFPRNNIKLPFESVTCASYSLELDKNLIFLLHA